MSGILLLIDGRFFQVLEGAAAVVDALYQRIAGDRRQERVTVIIARASALSYPFQPIVDIVSRQSYAYAAPAADHGRRRLRQDQLAGTGRREARATAVGRSWFSLDDADNF